MAGGGGERPGAEKRFSSRPVRRFARFAVPKLLTRLCFCKGLPANTGGRGEREELKSIVSIRSLEAFEKTEEDPPEPSCEQKGGTAA